MNIRCAEAKSKYSSKLPVAVQELMQLICDIDAMKAAMVEFELDLKKMPLGKISKNQLKQGYSILSDLQRVCFDLLAIPFSLSF